MDDFERQIRRAVSEERLHTFGPAGCSDEESIACYLWNLALTEALTVSLAGLEVALRNALHRTIAKRHGPNWWAPTEGVVLVEVGKADVETARRRLESRGAPVTADRMVEELNFGFWTHLFGRAYEQAPSGTISRPVGPKPLWPRHLNSVFFHHHRLRDRGFYAERLRDIRVLRNLASHHHAIYRGGSGSQGRFTSLESQHAQIREMTEWINPTWATTIAAVDRLGDVLAAGIAPFRDVVSELRDPG